MDVIADFPAYPEWAQGMHVAEVTEEGPDGRAREVHFEIEATPIKDSYNLRYDWSGDERVDWGWCTARRSRSSTAPTCSTSRRMLAPRSPTS